MSKLALSSPEAPLCQPLLHLKPLDVTPHFATELCWFSSNSPQHTMSVETVDANGVDVTVKQVGSITRLRAAVGPPASSKKICLGAEVVATEASNDDLQVASVDATAWSWCCPLKTAVFLRGGAIHAARIDLTQKNAR